LFTDSVLCQAVTDTSDTGGTHFAFARQPHTPEAVGDSTGSEYSFDDPLNEYKLLISRREEAGTREGQHPRTHLAKGQPQVVELVAQEVLGRLLPVFGVVVAARGAERATPCLEVKVAVAHTQALRVGSLEGQVGQGRLCRLEGPRRLRARCLQLLLLQQELPHRALRQASGGRHCLHCHHGALRVVVDAVARVLAVARAHEERARWRGRPQGQPSGVVRQPGRRRSGRGCAWALNTLNSTGHICRRRHALDCCCSSDSHCRR
jgi:hypothetical protein